MEETRTFMEKHKKLVLGLAFIFVYNLGFSKGCAATNHAVSNAFKELDRFYKTLPIRVF